MEAKELLDKILDFASRNNYSDLHFVSNSNLRIRNGNWEIETLEKIDDISLWIIDLNIIQEIIKVLIWENNFIHFWELKEFDSSYKITSDDRYRVNIYKDSSGYSIAMRLIPRNIPSLEELGLWKQIIDMCNRQKWLVLVTWPTGSGKSTNLASMIDYINKNFKKHIITIEDPIEFAFISSKSLINQREVGNHTNNFPDAIRASLREDPDVIVIWEMRDPETIKAALTLAETGHLVLSTLHTNDSVQTIDRIIDVFPWDVQNQIRMQLSQSLVWIISQRLLPRADLNWRVAVREILISDDAVRNLIISWKTNQLYSVLEVGQSKWMVLMDKYALLLYKKDLITKETLLGVVRDKESISLMID